MSNYLRNRPFMIISYSYVLAAGQKSNTKNFGNEAQWEPIENMVISDRVSNKQMQAAELIIDLFENKVVKCRDASLDHDKLINTFVGRHQDEVKAALLQWVKNDPANLVKVQAFVERYKTQPEEAGDAEGNPN